MKRTYFVILFSFVAVFAPAVGAQVVDAPHRNKASVEGRQEERIRRPSLLHELNLSADQVERMKEMNRLRRPRLEQALAAHRDANRALDAAIYADAVNEDEIARRLNDVQAAQSKIAALRAESELNIRKMLTAEQLVKFRELRGRFGAARENFREIRRHRRGRMDRREQLPRPN